MVPPDFGERHPGSHPLDPGLWCDFPRPSILLPADPAFDGIAADFYDIQRELFGGDVHYFAADPFHEGGNAAGVDMAAYARGCYRQMGQMCIRDRKSPLGSTMAHLPLVNCSLACQWVG